MSNRVFLAASLPPLALPAMALLALGGHACTPDVTALIDQVVEQNQSSRDFITVDLTWSPIADQLLVSGAGRDGRELSKVDLRNGIRTVIRSSEQPAAVAASTFEDCIAWIEGKSITLLDSRGTTLGQLSFEQDILVASFAPARSELAVATAGADGGSRLWRVRAGSATPEPAQSFDLRIVKLGWRGADVLLTTTDADELDSSLWRCQDADAPCTVLADQVPAEGFSVFAASPDGSKVYFEWDRVQNVHQASEPAVVGIDGAAPRRLVADTLPFYAGSEPTAWWSLDGQAVSFGCQRTALQRHVCTVGLDGRVSSIELRPGFEQERFSPSPDRRRLAYVARGTRDELEIRVVNADGSGDRLVSELRPANPLALANLREVSWRSSDGLEMSGLLARPPGTASVPLLVDLHGGPMGGIALDVPAVTVGSTAEWHYWVALGYAVFIPNDRRSHLAGIGPYQAMVDSGDWTALPIADVLTGIDAVVAAGGIDGSRVGLLGHSAGAFLAYQLHARHSSRFKLVFAKGGFANLSYLFELLDLDVCKLDVFEYGSDPVECARRIEINSAYPFMASATAPLYIASGGLEEAQWPADYRDALTALGRPVMETTYEDEVHIIEDPENQRDLLRRVTEFVRQHL